MRRTGETSLEGHAADPADPSRRFVVELVLNGVPTFIARADLFDTDLWESGLGDGCYGFAFHIDPAVRPSLRSAFVRIANLERVVGEPIHFDAAAPFAASAAPAGEVRWLGGLRLGGWVRRPTNGDVDGGLPVIEAWADGVLAGTARADVWRSVVHGNLETAEPGFALTLPREFADGRAKSVDVTCNGRALPGSPVQLIAFADGLEDFLERHAEIDTERPRGRLFDQSFPDAVPFEQLAAFEARFPLIALPRPPGAPTSVAIAVIGEAGADATMSALGLDKQTGFVGAILPAASGPTAFAARDLTRFLEADAKDCAVVVVIPAGTRPRPGGLGRLIAAIASDPAADIAYGDVLVSQEDGGLRPLALPAFDYERTLEQGLGGQCFAMRRGAALAAARRGIGELHRLFLTPLDGGAIHRGAHLHVPGFGIVLPPPDRQSGSEALLKATREHLAARGVGAEVAARPAGSLPAVRVTRQAASRTVTLILDAGGDATQVEAAIEAFEATRAASRAALMVIAPAPGEALAQRLQLSAIELCEARPRQSRAERLGAAAMAAKGEIICFLDAGLRPTAAGWLDELLSRAAEPDVGAVGPVLARPSGVILQAGFVLRATGRPVAAFADRRIGDPGYGDALAAARQVSALSDLCFLTRRADFLALGGFDPMLFPSHYGAIDYCLKLQALGKRIVVTPDASLVLAGTVPDDSALAPLFERLRAREERALFARWAGVLANDPMYSPLLDRGPVPYSGLAWPPGDVTPRRANVPAARDVPPGW